MAFLEKETFTRLLKVVIGVIIGGVFPSSKTVSFFKK